MDVQSGYPYWAIRNGLMMSFPPLREGLRCEVVVIGGGITGAIIADRLVSEGFEVAVVERCEIGWGSTAASTALLQYEIDTHMTELAQRYGEQQAARVYLACAAALEGIEDLAGDVGGTGFRRQDSLYIASHSWHVRRMREEEAMRRAHGLDVEWLGPADIESRYGFCRPGAILSRQAARCDPYRMAYRLLSRVRRNGGRVHGASEVERIEARPRGVALRMAGGMRVDAGHVVVATGYSGQEWLRQKVAANRSTYAFVSQPLEASVLGWVAGTVLWESSRPYLYLRACDDGRLMAGGGDDLIDVPARRDRRVSRKAHALVRRVHKLFPSIPIAPAFAWGGTFAETRDGLPFFGPHREHGPRVLFAMAYGGSGITFAIPGAEVLVALLRKRGHPLRALFSFDRLG